MPWSAGIPTGFRLFLLAPFLPFVDYIPSKRWDTIVKFNEAVLEISNLLLQRSKEEKKGIGEMAHDTNRSIIDTLSASIGSLCTCISGNFDIALVAAEYASRRVRLTEREIRDQVYHATGFLSSDIS